MRKDIGMVIATIIAIFALTFLILIQNQSIISGNNDEIKNEVINKNENIPENNNYYFNSNLSRGTIDPFGISETQEEVKPNLGLPVPLKEVYTCKKGGSRYNAISKAINDYCSDSSNRIGDIGNLVLRSNDYTLNSEIYVVEAVNTTYNYFKISNYNDDVYGIFIVDEYELNYYITSTTKEEFDNVKEGNVDFESYESIKIDSNTNNSLQL